MPRRTRCVDCEIPTLGSIRCFSCYKADLKSSGVRAGSNNSRWLGEKAKDYYKQYYDWLPQLCEFCDELITEYGISPDSLIRHHIDHDSSNNSVFNIVPVHRRCHELHHKTGKKMKEETKEKIRQARLDYWAKRRMAK